MNEQQQLTERAQALGIDQGRVLALARKYGPRLARLVLELLSQSDAPGAAPAPEPTHTAYLVGQLEAHLGHPAPPA